MPDTAHAVDTSVLVAAHVRGHQHRGIAGEPAAAATHVIGPVLAETWSVLRRHFRLPAEQVATVLADYVATRRLLAPDEAVYGRIVDRGGSLGLAGNVHDFVIASTAAAHGLRLVTLDRGMRRFATGQIDQLA